MNRVLTSLIITAGICTAATASAADANVNLNAIDHGQNKTYNFYEFESPPPDSGLSPRLISIGQLNPQTGYDNVSADLPLFGGNSRESYVQVVVTKQGLYSAQTYCSQQPYTFTAGGVTTIVFALNGSFAARPCASTS